MNMQDLPSRYDPNETFQYSKLRVSLHNDIRYQTRINLDSSNLVLYFGYNVRSKSRWVCVTSSDGTVLLKRSTIVFGRDLDLDCNAYNKDLYYKIRLEKKSSVSTEATEFDYLNWANSFNLTFVGSSYNMQRRIKQSTASFLAGG